MTGHHDLPEVVLAVCTAVLGALVSFLQRLRAGDAWSLLWFMTHMFTAAFAGMMVWLLALEQGLSGALTGMLTGMAGFSGGKAIELIEARMKREISP